MTIAQAVEQAHAVQSGMAEYAQCVQWLSEVDATVWYELIGTHQDERRENEFAGYSAGTPAETELFAPEPYSKLYVHYLCAKQDLLQQDYELYANDAALYNRAWTEFRSWYNRTHLPLQAVGLHSEWRGRKAVEG